MNLQSPLSRGDVVLTQFPYTDLSGSALRPALVVSKGQIGQDVVLVAISSILRGSTIPTDCTVDVSHPEFNLTGLRVASVIRAHKLAVVERQVIVRRLGKIGPQLLTEVDNLLRKVLSL